MPGKATASSICRYVCMFFVCCCNTDKHTYNLFMGTNIHGDKHTWGQTYMGTNIHMVGGIVVTSPLVHQSPGGQSPVGLSQSSFSSFGLTYPYLGLKNGGAPL